MTKDPKPALRAFVAKTFLRGGGRYRLEDRSPLFEDGVIDSLGLFLIVGFMERQFGVRVAPRELTLRNFASVEAMSRLVASKRKRR